MSMRDSASLIAMIEVTVELKLSQRKMSRQLIEYRRK